MSQTSNDLLVDGYISQAFLPNRSVEAYIIHLCKTTNFKELIQTLPSPSGPGVVFVIREATRRLHPQPLMWDSSGVPLWLLDYVIKDIGTVVPQTLWAPQNQNDIRQYVEEADLQLPVFFIHANGDLGLSVEDAVNGLCHSTLRDAHMQAQLGGKSTTHIRISVSSTRLVR